MADDTARETSSMVVEDRNGIGVATLSPDEFANASRLEDTFQTLISGLTYRRLVVDLSRIQETTSIGVAVLVAAEGLALIHKTRLVLACVDPKVARIIALTGADKVLKTFDTVDEALDSLRD